MDPATLMALASAASGFLGNNRMSKDQRDLLRISKGAASRLYGYGTGVPGSAPDEIAALAQDRAMLGEQQLGQRQQFLGALGANPQMGQMGDFLTNMSSLQQAQQMALGAQHSLNSLAIRRQALSQAAGIAQGSAGLAQEPQGGSQFPQMLGQIAQQMAYQKAYKQQQAQTQGVLNDPIGQKIGATEIAGAGGTFGPPVRSGPFQPGTWEPWDPWQSANNGGMMAPGNEPGGVNGMNNQLRQSSGYGRPLVPMEEEFRQMMAPFRRPQAFSNGVRLG